jgi:hypothetical protein
MRNSVSVLKEVNNRGSTRTPETRGFPSLSYDGFGFVKVKMRTPNTANSPVRSKADTF